MEPTVRKHTAWFWEPWKIIYLMKKHCHWFLGWYAFRYKNGKQVVADIDVVVIKPFTGARTLKHEMGHHTALKGCRSNKKAKELSAKYDRLTWHGLLQFRYKKEK